MSTPCKWAAPKARMDASRDSSYSPYCADQSFAWPVYLQLSSDPAITASTFSFTLRLEFSEIPFGNSLVVQGIIAGWAVDSWNKQCMFGSAANMARCVSIGDELVCVNDKECCREMLLECQ